MLGELVSVPARPRLQVVLLVGVLGFAAPAAAQTPDVNVGGHAGLSIPNIRAGTTDILSQNFASRRGLFFGIFVETRIAPRVSLVVDVNYTSQGGKRDGVQPITMDVGLPPLPTGAYYYADYHNETILDYVEIPVQLRLHFGPGRRFFVNAGPYVGFLVRARAVTSGSSLIYLDAGQSQPITPSPVPFDADTDVSDSLRRTNVGVTAGGGFRHRAGPGELVAEVHFQVGLTTIQKDVTTSGDNKTGALVASVGYSFPLRRGGSSKVKSHAR
jgi:hypothetical protein